MVYRPEHIQPESDQSAYSEGKISYENFMKKIIKTNLTFTPKMRRVSASSFSGGTMTLKCRTKRARNGNVIPAALEQEQDITQSITRNQDNLL